MEVLGEDLNRIFISFVRCPFRVMVSTDGLVLVLMVIASGPDFGPGVVSSGFVAFLVLELKYN